MRDGFIGVIDSGIGGISVLKELSKLMPNEKYLYYGDNLNAPYGNRSQRELLSLAIKGVDKLKAFKIKALVVACNTLSVNLLEDIKHYSNVATFGVFPPVESCQIKKEKTLLLATAKTAKKYIPSENLHVVSLLNAVSEIEANALNTSLINFSKELRDNSVGCFIDEKGYYKNVILGCTHYNFIKNQIFDHFRPQKMFGGELFTAKLVSKYLQSKKSLVNYKRNQILFIGESAKINSIIYNVSGQN